MKNTKMSLTENLYIINLYVANLLANIMKVKYMMTINIYMKYCSEILLFSVLFLIVLIKLRLINVICTVVRSGTGPSGHCSLK